jgi:hypothetical protein
MTNTGRVGVAVGGSALGVSVIVGEGVTVSVAVGVAVGVAVAVAEGRTKRVGKLLWSAGRSACWQAASVRSMIRVRIILITGL